jgi:hypothetical protein
MAEEFLIMFIVGPRTTGVNSKHGDCVDLSFAMPCFGVAGLTRRQSVAAIML